MTKEQTENIRDLWVCVRCGRFGYEKFETHSTSSARKDICDGRVYRFKSWLRRFKHREMMKKSEMKALEQAEKELFGNGKE